MPCSTCKHWMENGENMLNLDGIEIDCSVGSCSNTLVQDSIIKTEMDENVLAITAIVGVTTSVITKEHFECKYYEI